MDSAARTWTIPLSRGSLHARLELRRDNCQEQTALDTELEKVINHLLYVTCMMGYSLEDDLNHYSTTIDHNTAEQTSTLYYEGGYTIELHMRLNVTVAPADLRACMSHCLGEMHLLTDELDKILHPERLIVERAVATLVLVELRANFLPPVPPLYLRRRSLSLIEYLRILWRDLSEAAALVVWFNPDKFVESYPISDRSSREATDSAPAA